MSSTLTATRSSNTSRSSAIGKQVPVDAEVRNALRSKQSEAGWKAAGRIGVGAKTPARQRQLIRQVLAALRSTEAPGVAFWVRSRKPTAVAEAQIPWRFPLRLNAAELAGLAAWPTESGTELPVTRQRSRLLPPAKAIPTNGRVIGTSTYPGRERPLAISASDSLRHTWCVGPSGVGKSTLLARMIADDMAAGRAVIVIEPKSDLIRDCLAHVPADRIDDVVVMDPNDVVGAVGLNPLAGDRRNPELVADQLLAVFKGLYGASFGNRTTDIAAAGLHTLARVPNMSLVALPLLLSDPAFRRRCLAHVDDPIALEPFWAAFENWSEPARNEAVAPLLNKIRPFLLRPQLRTMLGQASPRFAIRDVFTKRRILLVDCSKGTLGSEVSALLAALVLASVWTETLRRSAIPAERRHPVSVYLDEFQEYLRLPTDLGDALAQARGLGVGFTLANQFAHQLDPAMRSAVLANCQNKICFRLANEDARIIAAKGSGLEPEDFAGLEAFEFYAQLVADHTIQPWCSAKSLPPDPPISDPDNIRAAFARALRAVDATTSNTTSARSSPASEIDAPTTSDLAADRPEAAHECRDRVSDRPTGRVDHQHLERLRAQAGRATSGADCLPFFDFIPHARGRRPPDPSGVQRQAQGQKGSPFRNGPNFNRSWTGERRGVMSPSPSGRVDRVRTSLTSHTLLRGAD